MVVVRERIDLLVRTIISLTYGDSPRRIPDASRLRARQARCSDAHRDGEGHWSELATATHSRAHVAPGVPVLHAGHAVHAGCRTGRSGHARAASAASAWGLLFLRLAPDFSEWATMSSVEMVDDRHGLQYVRRSYPHHGRAVGAHAEHSFLHCDSGARLDARVIYLPSQCVRECNYTGTSSTHAADIELAEP